MDDRNASTHPNGNIFYSEPSALDAKITEILRVVEEIQTHSKSVIERCYQNFFLKAATQMIANTPPPRCL